MAANKIVSVPVILLAVVGTGLLPSSGNLQASGKNGSATQIESEVDRATIQNMGEDAQIAELQDAQELEQAQREMIDELETRVKRVATVLATISAERDNNRAVLEVAQATKAQANEELANARTEQEQARALLAQMIHLRDNLERVRNQLEDNLAFTSRDLDRANNDVAQAQARHDAAMARIKASVDSCTQAAEEERIASEKTEVIEKRLTRAQARLASAKAALAKALNDLHATQEKIATLKEQLHIVEGGTAFTVRERPHNTIPDGDEPSTGVPQGMPVVGKPPTIEIAGPVYVPKSANQEDSAPRIDVNPIKVLPANPAKPLHIPHPGRAIGRSKSLPRMVDSAVLEPASNLTNYEPLEVLADTGMQISDVALGGAALLLGGVGAQALRRRRFR